MSNPQENHSSGLLYFIPYWIFEDDSLSSTCKLVYALLSGLAHGNQDKECFPSDKYIGDRLKISRQSANECVKELESRGAISKRNTAHPNAFKKRRYIKVHLECKESLRCREKPTTESQENPTHGSQENPTHSNKGYSNKEESSLTGAKESARTPRAPHVFVSALEHEKLLTDFGEEMVIRAYSRLSEWKSDTPKSKWKKNDNLAIQRWVVDALREDDIKLEKASKNHANRIKEMQGWCRTGNAKESLQEAHRQGKVMIFQNEVVFGDLPEGVIHFTHPQAKQRIEHCLKKIRP